MYCRQLYNLNDAIKQKHPEFVNRKGTVFYHDNARPHTSSVIRHKSLQLGWSVLLHLPYSPNQTDYRLFSSLQNALNGKTFITDEDIKLFSEQFFAKKRQGFF